MMETCNICFDIKLCKEFPCCKGKMVCGNCIIKMKDDIDNCPFCRKNINITRTQTDITIIESDRGGWCVEFFSTLLFWTSLLINLFMLYPLIKTSNYCNQDGVNCKELESFDIFFFLLTMVIYCFTIRLYTMGDPTPFRDIKSWFLWLILFNLMNNVVYIIVFSVRDNYIFLTSYSCILFMLTSMVILITSCVYGIKECIYNTNDTVVNNIYIHIIPTEPIQNEEENDESEESDYTIIEITERIPEPEEVVEPESEDVEEIIVQPRDEEILILEDEIETLLNEIEEIENLQGVIESIVIT
jgi:hypothetical protein